QGGAALGNVHIRFSGTPFFLEPPLEKTGDLSSGKNSPKVTTIQLLPKQIAEVVRQERENTSTTLDAPVNDFGYLPHRAVIVFQPLVLLNEARSEERRVGKEGRCGGGEDGGDG